MIVDELIALLGYKLTGEGDLKRFNAGIKNAERNLAAFAATASRYGAIVGAAVVAGTTLLGKSVLKTGAQFEGYNIRLTPLIGSQEKANEALKWIQNFAKSTPLEIADVTDAYANLVNYGLDPTNGTLQALTDAMAGSGKGVETLNRLTLALGQSWVKQKLQGGEILQLTEAGIPVWDMLATATGKNVQELQKLSEKGKLGRKEIQMLIDAIGKKYLGASDKFAKSFDGITSNLADNWTQFLKRIADSGFFPFMEGRLQSLLDNVNRWAADGTLDRWADRISKAFIAVAKAVEFVAGRIVRDVGVLVDLFGKLNPHVVEAVAAAFGLLLSRLFPLSFALFVAALALDDFLGYLNGADSKFGDFVKWIEDVTGASRELAQVIAGIVASFALLAAIRPIAFLKGVGNFFKGLVGGAAGEVAAGGAVGAGARAGGLRGLLGGLVSSSVATAMAGGVLYGGSLAVLDAQKSGATRTGEDVGYMVGRPSPGAADRNPRSDQFGGVFRGNADSPQGVNSGNPNAVTNMLANMNANIAKLGAGAQPGAVITDQSQDNRSYPVTVNASTTINVAQAAAAAAAAVGAVSAAVGQAAVAGASRIEREPAF